MSQRSRRTSPPPARSARKIDRERVMLLHQSGMPIAEIAADQHVATTTVWRFIRQAEPNRRALQAYIEGRADVLAHLQSKSIALQHEIIDSLAAEGVVAALSPHQKVGLLSVLNAQMGTIHDKERLERGKSTHNVGVIAKMMGAAFDKAHRTTIESAQMHDHAQDDGVSRT